MQTKEGQAILLPTMILNPTLRPATFEDWKLTFRLKKEGLKSHVESIWGWNEKEQQKLHKVSFEPKQTRIIQLQSDEIGYLTLKTSDKEVYIENLIIGKEYQNMGLGTRLVNSIIRKSKEQEKSVGLRVLKRNMRAQKFYEHLGFKKVSESEHHHELKKLF